MNAKKLMKPAAVFSALLVAIGVVAAPTVEIQQKSVGAAGRVTANVGYREARADKPPPGGNDQNVENIKTLCGLIGVSDQFHGSAPAKCGLTKTGREPRAVLCASPPPGNTSQTEDSNNRKCEYCVPLDSEVKCDEELSVDASVETSFDLPIYGVQVKCEGKAKYKASAKAKIEVQNTKWNSVEGGEGTDEATDYMSSLTKSSASSEAAISLGAGCTFDGKVATAEMSAKLGIKCSMKSTVTLGTKDKRDKKTCGDEPCALTATAESDSAARIMMKAVAAPCPVDAGTADAADPEPAPPEDAGAPDVTPTLDTEIVKFGRAR